MGTNPANALLWALSLLGVTYKEERGTLPAHFQVEGEPEKLPLEPVEAARLRAEIIRAQQIVAEHTYPDKVTHHLADMRSMLKDVKASNLRVWKAEMERRLDEFEFDLRKVGLAD